MIQSGKIRLVAVGSPQRWFLVPDVPTMSESGYGGLVSQWIGAYVRADTPPAIVDRRIDECPARVAQDLNRLADLHELGLPH